MHTARSVPLGRRRGWHSVPWAVAAVIALGGCYRSPPASRFPNAEAALSRMHASQSCSTGVSGEAKLEYFGDGGRLAGNLLYMAAAPEQVRLDVFSPFGATISTLTSDGRRFTLMDLRSKTFLSGPANTCNLQRFTRVPMPPHAFVQLLRGEAPVLVHARSGARIDWEAGSYLVRIQSQHRAEQEIRLLPLEADYALPFAQQRVRVLGVKVRQAGAPLYEVELSDHAPAAMSVARVDPEGIDPPLPASGPQCTAELPRRLRFVVGSGEHDLTLVSREIAHNPPLPSGVFSAQPSPGYAVRDAFCSD